MLVHELMTRDVVTVRSDTPIAEAARTLLDRDVTAAPVVYEDGRLVAIVSRRDLIADRDVQDPRAHLSPVYQSVTPPHLVRHVMTRDVVVVTPTRDIAHAAHLMIEHGLASLPVVDEGRLVGMLSVTDILRSHTHSDGDIADALHQRFFEYGDAQALGAVVVDDGVVTVSETDDRLASRIALAVAGTTEGVTGVHFTARK
jgi:CBS-domain-containing membrane protein